MLARLADETFDLVVVGGGITGAGAALDAADRGLRVALVERDDLASGTSSKSSKLVHGGLRYLQTGDVQLVKEALRERQRLLDNAPHLVRPLPFVLPVLHEGGAVPAKLAKALGSALWAYDRAGAARIGEQYRRLDRDAVLDLAPTLPPERVAGGYLYWDARADDARLVLAVARTAASLGAVVTTRTPVCGMAHDGAGRIRSVTVDTGEEAIEVRTRAVINAGGVWADDVRALDEGHHPDTLRPAKGIHLVIPLARVGVRAAIVVPVPQDKRSLFVVPWGDHAYVGTTDTDHDGPLDDPQCTPDDIAYVLSALNHSFTSGITEADVTGTWAGLRPLVKAAGSSRTADLSRRHTVQVAVSGVVTVTGGKLTTYRPMAEEAVDAVDALLGRRSRCRTAGLRVLGAPPPTGAPAGEGTPPDDHLVGRFGTEAPLVRALAETHPALAEPLVPGLPYLAAEAVWAARHEQATTLTDVLERRTRARLLDHRATLRAAPAVAALLAPELGWDAAEQDRQVDDYRRSARHEWASAGLHDRTVNEP
jgi:glycerol-3-phosphate dehydrogenase